ncbi:hypothetical protein IJ098_03665 [Candidatus Saccharibacteria bacterium]|nr:hypothetical protein [Candidatus Saccharibacteria bacterium]
MTPRNVSVREAFGPNRTPAGEAAVRRAMEYAAKEQADLLRRAAALDKKK